MSEESKYHIWQERAPHGPMFVHTPTGDDIFFGGDEASAKQCLAELQRIEAAERRSLAVADERVKEANNLRVQLASAVEECAKIAESHTMVGSSFYEESYNEACEDIAKAIRDEFAQSDEKGN